MGCKVVCTVEEWWKGEIERGHAEVEILDCPRRSMTNKLCAGLVDRPYTRRL